MLRPLSALMRWLAGPQLSFDFRPAPRTAGELLARLQELGLRRIARCTLTRTRSVMVSHSADELRVHEGYLDAPEEVLRAIVAFVEGRTAAERRTARRIILSHPVQSTPAPARAPRLHPRDAALVAELADRHRELNARHFGGALREVTIRISRRMRTRLGHYTAATAHADAEISISLRHLQRDGADEALHTLLHEMVHQWQDESGLSIDHGPSFRTKAREVGITPSARRTVERRPGSMLRRTAAREP